MPFAKLEYVRRDDINMEKLVQHRKRKERRKPSWETVRKEEYTESATSF